MTKEFKSALILIAIGMLFWIFPLIPLIFSCSAIDFICAFGSGFLWMLVGIPISLIFILSGFSQMYKFHQRTTSHTLFWGIALLAILAVLLLPFWWDLTPAAKKKDAEEQRQYDLMIQKINEQNRIEDQKQKDFIEKQKTN